MEEEEEMLKEPVEQLQDGGQAEEEGGGESNWQDRFWNGYQHDENNDIPEVSLIKTTEPKEEVKEDIPLEEEIQVEKISPNKESPKKVLSGTKRRSTLSGAKTPGHQKTSESIHFN